MEKENAGKILLTGFPHMKDRVRDGKICRYVDGDKSFGPVQTDGNFFYLRECLTILPLIRAGLE